MIRRETRGVATSALLVLAASGCFTDADGRQPDGNALYYPTGVLLSPGGTTLYVANSDFDLQFSGGSVQAIDARAVRDAVQLIPDQIAAGNSTTDACAAAGLPTNDDPFLHPGPCAALDVAPFVRSSAFIGAFASGLLLTHDPSGERARLFAPVRGDPSITYFDVQDDREADAAAAPTFELDCQAGDDGFCSDAHRLGRDPDRNLRGLQLPADPLGIAASSDGTAIVSAHQTAEAASLVSNDWDGRPELSYFLSGLPVGPTEIASIPEPGFVPFAQQAASDADTVFSYLSGFALTYRSTAEVDILRYFPDSAAAPPRPFIVRSHAFPVTTGASNFDSRGIALLDRARRTCETTCRDDTHPSAADEYACLLACAEEHPVRVFLANRSPSSLVIGEMRTFTNELAVPGEPEPVLTNAFEGIELFDSVPLDFGPSRVEVGQVVGDDGALEDRVFVVCFDSRRLFIYDPERAAIEAVVNTGRGPHDFAIDARESEDGDAHALLYVGHFTDSYIGVVDLDRRRPLTYGQLIASVGIPNPPAESQ